MSVEGLFVEAILILVLIVLNGFFSSAEIAIISAKRSVIDKLAKEGNLSASVVARLKEDPDRFLATVQIGVTVVGTLASAIGGVTAIKAIKPIISTIQIEAVQTAAELLALAVVVVSISYATLVLGELVPKSIALRYAERVACFSARPIDYLATITAAFVKLLTGSTGAVLKVLGIKNHEQKVFVSEEEIKFFIKEGRATGVFEETEAALLHGVFEFADTTVKEVMVPKHKFSAIEVSMPPDAALKYISDSGFSRYPVYDGTLEKVIGVLFNKDIFKALEEKRAIVLRDLIRTPYFVPNSIMISRLLREMQRRKVHMAIVIDEHGDVDGLVTIEDILEEIVGEIEDEYDIGGKGGVVERQRDGTLIVDASASLRDIADAGVTIEDEQEDFHTLAGFMLAKLQRVPRGGEFVVHKDLRLTVVDVEGNRIIKVKVERLDNTKSQRPA